MPISMRPNWWIYLVIFSLVALVQPNQSIPIVSKTYVQNAVEQGAVCLDGSPAVYHFDAGKGEGANNWIVYLLGGGWCINSTIFESRNLSFADSCTHRAFSDAGSSLKMRDMEFRGVVSGDENVNYFHNWNRAVIRYCDGGSFSGDIDKPDPVTGLYYRGARIFNVVVKELMSKGLKDAQNVILIGGSAGGLATMIHCDNFRSLFPNNVRVKCMADSGFFVRMKEPQYAQFFETVFGYVVEKQQLVNILPKECTSKMDPLSCFFPQNLVQYVKTPILLYNSAFDVYQIANSFSQDLAYTIFNRQPVSPADMTMLLDLKQQLINALPSKGYLITSRSSHDFGRNAGYKMHIFPSNNNSQSVESLMLDWYFDRNTPKVIDPSDVPIFALN